MNLVEQVRAAGVVGAGGGGFPTHVKLAAQADTVIANGAECEPLLHKDAAVMEREAELVVRGLELAMHAVQAKSGIIGIKAKNKHAVATMQAACAGKPLRVHLLADVYPAGDEYDLVFETTGRLIPPGGIPLKVGVVVCNVETFANIARAASGQAVTHKTLTVGGAVRTPVTLTVPLGTRLLDCVAAAGGATVPDPVLCLGGMMMGETTADFSRPVTKTTGGIIVLPRDHPVVQRKLKPAAVQHAIGKSACDQCRYCTEFCPRFLLGYAVQPHQVMRSLAFTATGEAHWNEWAALCCACGLCTLYSCPEQLFPKEACDRAKGELRKANVRWSGPTEVRPHGMRDGRKVPIRSLVQKLSIGAYEHPAPWEPRTVTPRELVLLLKQSAGAPSRAIVRVGERVVAGQPLSAIPDQALAAIIHAPVAATVAEVTDQAVVLHCTGGTN
ncbi:4Fe-4S dicluster domain-containing protein [Opitutus sp. ER46]|uniref:4Fe-4S dicluster domain-containing protein n=1 Tax=Opitutus sp. ER46 TaxID=2161864 RepID=UPI000D2F7555|nr:4Fe-4S dicluster domain-containing protein [Opitutus sp. ER46]PTX96396.1 NADH dehydrogenase subunit [Opitutus sp. ER46]